jgi:hypothetical protein
LRRGSTCPDATWLAGTVPAEAAREDDLMADDEFRHVSEEFSVWQAGDAGTLNAKHLGTQAVELSKAATFKSASLTLHGDPETGEITHKRLKLITAPRDPVTRGYDFDHPLKEWVGDDNQVDRLRAFLAGDLTVGRYRIIDVNTPTGDIVGLLEGDAGRSADLLSELTKTLSAERWPMHCKPRPPARGQQSAP